jgi:hypothetical protein
MDQSMLPRAQPMAARKTAVAAPRVTAAGAADAEAVSAKAPARQMATASADDWEEF